MSDEQEYAKRMDAELSVVLRRYIEVLLDRHDAEQCPAVKDILWNEIIDADHLYGYAKGDDASWLDTRKS